jgi:helix-turn-helix protein
MSKKDKVNWEKLCKQLQEALAKEIKENQNLDEQLADAQIEVIQASGIIKYLEKCISDYTDVVNANKSI